jgi:hypothetical protein
MVNIQVPTFFFFFAKKIFFLQFLSRCYIGLLVAGPLNHYWYELMNKVFAGKTGTKVKIGQLLFQNFIISPFMNSGKI